MASSSEWSTKDGEGGKWPDGLENAFLGGVHGGARVGFGVGVAVEVEEAVDGVQGDFAEREITSLGGFTNRRFRADQDFSVVKSDNVGRGGIVEEVAVHRGQRRIIEQRNLDFGE